MRERIVIKYKKNVGIIIKGRMTDKHLGYAIANLRKIEFERRKTRTKKHSAYKTIRKFFRCLYKSLQPTPKEQHATCEIPLMIEAKQWAE